MLFTKKLNLPEFTQNKTLTKTLYTFIGEQNFKNLYNRKNSITPYFCDFL